jgi:hypothetical protein
VTDHDESREAKDAHTFLSEEHARTSNSRRKNPPIVFTSCFHWAPFEAEGNQNSLLDNEDQSKKTRARKQRRSRTNRRFNIKKKHEKHSSVGSSKKASRPPASLSQEAATTKPIIAAKQTPFD